MTDDVVNNAKGAKKRTDYSKKGFNAVQIAEQIDQVREWLAYGYRPFQIRTKCIERWGMKPATADLRIKAARQTSLREISNIERQEKAAQVLDTLDEALKVALETKQTASVIGLMRLSTEILGITSKGG